MAPLARRRQTRLVGPQAGAQRSPGHAECGFCASLARAEGLGGAGGTGSPLAAAPGTGRGWRPHLARAGAAAGAGREYGPGPVERGAPAGTPRRLVSARAARPGPSQHAKAEDERDKVRLRSPAPITSWDPVSVYPLGSRPELP